MPPLAVSPTFEEIRFVPGKKEKKERKKKEKAKEGKNWCFTILSRTSLIPQRFGGRVLERSRIDNSKCRFVEENLAVAGHTSL